jgi:ribonuclease P protein component
VTKKELNNSQRTAVKSFSLPRADILRGRKHFQRLFEQPVKLFSEKHLFLRFYIITERETACKMGFIAPKRLGTASQRNYIKRILREVYRQNRHCLMQTVRAASIEFYGAFMTKTSDLNFETAESEVISLLNRAVNYIHSTREL